MPLSWVQFFKLPPIKYALLAGGSTMVAGTVLTTFNALRLASECANAVDSVAKLPKLGDEIIISNGEADIKVLNHTLPIEILKIIFPMPDIGFNAKKLNPLPSYCEDGVLTWGLYTTFQIALAIAAMVAIAVLSRDFYNTLSRNNSTNSFTNSLTVSLMRESDEDELCVFNV